MKRKKKSQSVLLFISGWIRAHFWHCWSVTVDRQGGKQAAEIFLNAREDASEASHRSLIKSDSTIQIWL